MHAHSDTDVNAIEAARRFAVAAHGEQSYGDRPYGDHLDEVAAIARAYGRTVAIVAYLHDVLEDTTVGREEIAHRFGRRAADCVVVLSDEPGSSRRERKERTYAKLAAADEHLSPALIVKAADRLANTRACVRDGEASLLKMYRREYGAFRRAVHRCDLCEEIWRELDALAGDPKA